MYIYGLQWSNTEMLLYMFQLLFFQWWNVTKYFYSSTVLKYNYEVLYMSIYILCYLILLLVSVLKANIVLFTTFIWQL